MEERIKMLIELKNAVETGTENWDILTRLESYFFGEVSTCKCKTGTLRSKLNHYYELHKGEII